MMKITLVLTLFTIGAQCRDYYYNKPLVPFYKEDGGQQQYLTTSKRMIIPGTHGRSYEVSMSPARNIFEMHLGHNQHYQQTNQGHSQQFNAYPQQNSYAAAGSQSVGSYSQSQQNPGNQGGYTQSQSQQSPVNQGGYTQSQSQQNTGTQGGYVQSQSQQSSGTLGSYSQTHSQQSSANVGASSQSHYQQNSNNIGSAAGQSYYQQNPNSIGSSNPSYYQQNPASLGASGTQSYYQQNDANQGSSSHHQSQQFQTANSNGKPVTRLIRKCHPNGRCEYIADDRQHQQIQQQARASILPASGNCNKLQHLGQTQRHTSTPINSKNGLRDRRLFPYSEVPIAQYPYKK